MSHNDSTVVISWLPPASSNRNITSFSVSVIKPGGSMDYMTSNGEMTTYTINGLG